MSSETPPKLALRVKSKKSQNAVLRDVDVKDKVADLISQLSTLTGVPEDKMAILKGFPPKRIAFDPENLIESLGLQHQDTLIIEVGPSGTPEKCNDGQGANSSNALQNAATLEQPGTSRSTQPANDPAPSTSGADNGSIPETVQNDGLLLRQIVPSDNSCLFTSVTFCLSGGLPRDNDEGSSFLREMIANTVAGDPVKYNEAILGRPNAEYVEWIKKPESWGGGIELSILADFYGLQISVIDIQSLHASNFGEDKNFSQQIFLIYDGIHYDPLYFEPFMGGGHRTVFPVSDSRMTELAIQLGREAKASNQFTDLKNFSLRCQICNTLLKGQKEAQEHAKKTAHTAFAEIIKK